jgi:hypothetical protein
LYPGTISPHPFNIGLKYLIIIKNIKEVVSNVEINFNPAIGLK